jgi:CRP-like cAMP-binding protein
MSEAVGAAEGARVEAAAFLASVPLFADMGEEGLEELAGVLRLLEFRTSDVLWREGDEADGLHLIVEGRISASRRLPGARDLELAVLGPGEVLGEIPLLGGGRRTATARAIEPATALFLSRLDFSALVERLSPTALNLKRRIANVVCDRLRRRYAVLAELLGGDETDRRSTATASKLEPWAAANPDAGYLRRLQFFRAFGPDELDEVLGASYFAHCPARHAISVEGEAREDCYVTINGAVAGVIERGERRIRVELAGPGRAFGCAHAIDGGPSSVAAVARERTLLLVVPRAAFEHFLHGDTAGSHAFLEAIQRDLVAALHQAERPQARLALFDP